MKYAILERLAKLSDKEFDRVVDATCHSARRLPTAADYLAEAAPFLKRYRDKEALERRERIENAPNKCPYCAGYGTVEALKRGTPYKYCFRCSFCGTSNTLGLSRDVPLWDTDYHTEEFEILPMHPEKLRPRLVAVPDEPAHPPGP